MIGLLASYLSTRLVVVFFNGASAGTYDYFFHLAISPQDLLYSGLKAVVFAAVVALVHCAYGYYASGGPAGVGQAAGRALRTAILAIGILDVLMTFRAVGPRAPDPGNGDLSRGQTHYTHEDRVRPSRRDRHSRSRRRRRDNGSTRFGKSRAEHRHLRRCSSHSRSHQRRGAGSVPRRQRRPNRRNRIRNRRIRCAVADSDR